MADVASLDTWANGFEFRVSGSAFRVSDSAGLFAIIRADSRLKTPRPLFVFFVCFVGNNPNPCPFAYSVGQKFKFRVPGPGF